jgi:DNA invertase Pin-like site-specific DNA recombinase
MSTNTNGNGLRLTGAGAAYLRVSTDRQDTERQLASIRAFLERHGVSIPASHWFEDHGWERDADATRPEFNRLLALARAGKLAWVVVDRLDRFGTRSAKRLFGYLADLEDAGCRLFDASGREWTGEDDATELTAWLGGKTSTKEQREKSYRTLSGMARRAADGDWQGGAPGLGFDVGCFDRATDRELWRVVFEGRAVVGTTTRRGKERPVYHVKRRKVYPDGREERLDGSVVFRTSKDTQALRLVPTRDKARLAAAQNVFRRYAGESVSLFGLAKELNTLGIRNSFGEAFQGADIRRLLGNEAYLGYPSFGKRRTGRFHRHAQAGVVELEPGLRGKDTTCAPADIIRSGRCWFEPLIDRPTWDKVQKKLADRPQAARAPKSPSLYLAGLVTCGNCGARMVPGRQRQDYHCGTYDRHLKRGTLADSACLRNGVKQSVLEEYVSRYLEETAQRLELLTGAEPGHLTDRLKEQAQGAERAFFDGLSRLCAYLAEYHPAAYGLLLQEQEEAAAVTAAAGGEVCLAKVLGDDLAKMHRQTKDREPRAVPDFAASLLAAYRRNFDAAALASQVAALEAEHTALMHRYADLPTPRARDKAKAELAQLEARIADLEGQQAGAADRVEAEWRQLLDLRQAIASAREALASPDGEQALRRRAEALRGVILRVECEFVVTGKRGRGGPGQAGSRLVALNFLPIAGDGKRYAVNVGERCHASPWK